MKEKTKEILIIVAGSLLSFIVWGTIILFIVGAAVEWRLAMTGGEEGGSIIGAAIGWPEARFSVAILVTVIALFLYWLVRRVGEENPPSSA